MESLDRYNPDFIPICWACFTKYSKTTRSGKHWFNYEWEHHQIYVDVRTTSPLVTKPEETSYEIRIWERYKKSNRDDGVCDPEHFLLGDNDFEFIKQFTLLMPSNQDFLAHRAEVDYTKDIKKYLLSTEYGKTEQFTMSKPPFLKFRHLDYQSPDYDFKAPVARQFYIEFFKKLVRAFADPPEPPLDETENNHLTQRLKRK